MSDRCSGHCCLFFSIGAPDEFSALVAQRVTGGDIYAEELMQIKSMVLYRGVMKNPFHPVVPHPRILDADLPEPQHWWTCKHYDVENNNCEIYESRPTMCRSYPNGHPCLYVGCTWDEARAGIGLIPVRNLTRGRWRKYSAVSCSYVEINETDTPRS